MSNGWPEAGSEMTRPEIGRFVSSRITRTAFGNAWLHDADAVNFAQPVDDGERRARHAHKDSAKRSLR